MISNDRISRKQRLRALSDNKAKIALILALILILLVIGKTYKAQFEILLSNRLFNNIFEGGISKDVDSLVIKTSRSFIMSSIPKIDTVSHDSAGIVFMRISQAWPFELPLVFFAQRLQEMSRISGIDCNCVQFGDSDSLVCGLLSGDRPRAKVVAIPDRKTILEGRFLGIIFENIYELGNQDIIKIVESKIPFGYLADIDVYPAGEIRRQLHSDWVSAILTIPTSREDLIKHDLIRNEYKSDYRDISIDLLNRYPNLAFIRFKRSDDADYSFVEALTDRAKEKKVGYIYENSAPDRIDSLAFSAGLTFITHDKILNYSDKSLTEIQIDLIAGLVHLGDPGKTAIKVDISRIKARRMIDLMKYLKKIGIDILYINELTDHQEFIIEDL